MKKFLVTVGVIGIFLLYGVYQKLALTPIDAATVQPDALTGNGNNTSSNDVTGTTSPTSTPTLDPTATSNPTTAPITTTPKPTSPPTTAPVNSGKYKNGTYTGSVADAYYGNVQVQAVVSGATDTSMAFIQSLGVALQNALN